MLSKSHSTVVRISSSSLLFKMASKAFAIIAGVGPGTVRPIPEVSSDIKTLTSYRAPLLPANSPKHTRLSC